MRADRRQGPQTRRFLPRKGVSLALAIAVHLVFIAVLIFSIRWQNTPPTPVTAELYAAPSPVVAPPPPPPPPPEPRPEPRPEPPVPKPEPPKALPAEKPDPRAADIALKARQEQERQRTEQAAREKKEREQKEAERKLAEEKKRADDKKAAESRERLQREMDAMRAQVDREVQARAQAEQQVRAQADAAARESAARSSAQADWIRRIQAKIKGNVTVPPDLAGNPEAIFDIVQLPTGEIIDVQLRKSSGTRAYDDAVQRAILKSSPLPRPERAEIFTRALTLKFRPLD